MKNLELLIITLVLCIIRPSIASSWDINRDHSEVIFTVPYLGASSVTGRFKSFRGRMNYNDGKIEELHIAVDVKSIDTGNALRDGHLKSQDFLDIEKFPKIRFSSKDVNSVSNDAFVADGVLEVHGKQKQQSIRFKMSGPIKDPWGFESRFVEFRFSIDKSDYFLEWNKKTLDAKYLIGDIIQVHGRFQLQEQGTKTPGSRHLIPNTEYTKLGQELAQGKISNEEYSELIEKRKSSTQSLEVINIKTPEDSQPASISTTKECSQRKSFNWWTAYLVMGFISFISVILVSFQGKVYLMSLLPKDTDETGPMAVIMDLLLIPIIGAYVWAMWELAFV